MTNTANSDTSESSGKSRTSGVWGKKAVQFYSELRNQPVIVLTTRGERYAGTLIGVDVYDIIIRQPSGLEMLLSKGNIVYVHRSTGNGTAKDSKA